MRRVLLLCLLLLASSSLSSAAQTPWPEPRPHHIEKEWKRTEPQPVPAKYYCNSTQPSYPNGYPFLPPVTRTDGLAEYYGPLLTWTPNDNATACNIRQLYFWVATVYGKAANGAGPDISVYMIRHVDKAVVVQPLSWDIVSIQYTEGTLYRIDAEQIPANPDPNGLQGDFDFVIDVIGTPAQAGASQPHRR